MSQKWNNILSQKSIVIKIKSINNAFFKFLRVKMAMFKRIQELIYTSNLDEVNLECIDLYKNINELSRQAFYDKDEAARLAVHRILYVINLAHLAISWELPAKNLMHPFISSIKYLLEKHWQQSEQSKYDHILSDIPAVENFPAWVKQKVAEHASNELHPLFTFLRDAATFEQMREFFFQETPLEMLFGDILAFMLPGVYGSIKVEFLKNYWDEVGHAEDHRVHRNLRAKLMNTVQIPINCYVQNIELLICEELELINMYLSLATNRPKQSELVGVMLATELMIPNRFQYSIKGWQRVGLKEDDLDYLIEHTSVDQAHSEDWLNQVVMPILINNPAAMSEVVLGIFRRLSIAMSVLDRLYNKIQTTETACIGKFKRK